MSKPSKPPATDKKHEHDLATFEHLPAATKALMKLKELDEKTTGPEEVVITRKIEAEARQSRP